MPDPAGAVVLDMTRFEFDTQDAAIPEGGNLLITNSDAFVHDFTFDEKDIKVSIGPRSEALVELNDLAPGTYDYFCSLHSDGVTGMAGTFTIEG